LWLYKREHEEHGNGNADNDQDESIDEQYNHNCAASSAKRSRQQIDQFDENNGPLSSAGNVDEEAIKSLIDQMIGSIEREQQQQQQQSLQTDREANKKRKLYVIEQESLTSLAQRENKKRILDPIGEHFSWCPWLTVCNTRPAFSVFSDVVVKLLRKSEQDATKSPNLLSSKAPPLETNTTITSTTSRLSLSPQRLRPPVAAAAAASSSTDQTQALLDKIKSVQSLLINCTSHLSYNSS
jgi:hypothetical protein